MRPPTRSVAGLRFWAYSQIEYITAAMLARHIKAGGARVLQLGGSTRDLYYYPKVSGRSISQYLQREAVRGFANVKRRVQSPSCSGCPGKDVLRDSSWCLTVCRQQT